MTVLVLQSGERVEFETFWIPAPRSSTSDGSDRETLIVLAFKEPPPRESWILATIDDTCVALASAEQIGDSIQSNLLCFGWTCAPLVQFGVELTLFSMTAGVQAETTLKFWEQASPAARANPPALRIFLGKDGVRPGRASDLWTKGELRLIGPLGEQGEIMPARRVGPNGPLRLEISPRHAQGAHPFAGAEFTPWRIDVKALCEVTRTTLGHMGAWRFSRRLLSVDRFQPSYFESFWPQGRRDLVMTELGTLALDGDIVRFEVAGARPGDFICVAPSLEQAEIAADNGGGPSAGEHPTEIEWDDELKLFEIVQDEERRDLYLWPVAPAGAPTQSPKKKFLRFEQESVDRLISIIRAEMKTIVADNEQPFDSEASRKTTPNWIGRRAEIERFLERDRKKNPGRPAQIDSFLNGLAATRPCFAAYRLAHRRLAYLRKESAKDHETLDDMMKLLVVSGRPLLHRLWSYSIETSLADSGLRRKFLDARRRARRALNDQDRDALVPMIWAKFGDAEEDSGGKIDAADLENWRRGVEKWLDDTARDPQTRAALLRMEPLARRAIGATIAFDLQTLAEPGLEKDIEWIEGHLGAKSGDVDEGLRDALAWIAARPESYDSVAPGFFNRLNAATNKTELPIIHVSEARAARAAWKIGEIDKALWTIRNIVRRQEGSDWKLERFAPDDPALAGDGAVAADAAVAARLDTISRTDADPFRRSLARQALGFPAAARAAALKTLLVSRASAGIVEEPPKTGGAAAVRLPAAEARWMAVAPLFDENNASGIPDVWRHSIEKYRNDEWNALRAQGLDASAVLEETAKILAGEAFDKDLLEDIEQTLEAASRAIEGTKAKLEALLRDTSISAGRIQNLETLRDEFAKEEAAYVREAGSALQQGWTSATADRIARLASIMRSLEAARDFAATVDYVGQQLDN